MRRPLATVPAGARLRLELGEGAGARLALAEVLQHGVDQGAAGEDGRALLGRTGLEQLGGLEVVDGQVGPEKKPEASESSQAACSS